MRERERERERERVALFSQSIFHCVYFSDHLIQFNLSNGTVNLSCCQGFQLAHIENTCERK
jgi:hypothetical protein